MITSNVEIPIQFHNAKKNTVNAGTSVFSGVSVSIVCTDTDIK